MRGHRYWHMLLSCPGFNLGFLTPLAGWLHQSSMRVQARRKRTRKIFCPPYIGELDCLSVRRRRLSRRGAARRPRLGRCDGLGAAAAAAPESDPPHSRLPRIRSLERSESRRCEPRGARIRYARVLQDASRKLKAPGSRPIFPSFCGNLWYGPWKRELSGVSLRTSTLYGRVLCILQSLSLFAKVCPS